MSLFRGISPHELRGSQYMILHGIDNMLPGKFKHELVSFH